MEEDVQVVPKAGEGYAGPINAPSVRLSSQVIVAVLQLHTHVSLSIMMHG